MLEQTLLNEFPVSFNQQFSCNGQSRVTGAILSRYRVRNMIDRVIHFNIQVAILQHCMIHLDQQVLVIRHPVFVSHQSDVVFLLLISSGDFGEVHRHKGRLTQVLHEQRAPTTITVTLIGGCYARDGKQ